MLQKNFVADNIMIYQNFGFSDPPPSPNSSAFHTNSLIKLFFGSSTNTDKLNNEIDTLFDESEVCRKKIDFMLQEMNKNVRNQIKEFSLPPTAKQFSFQQLNIIDKNPREITAMEKRIFFIFVEKIVFIFRILKRSNFSAYFPSFRRKVQHVIEQIYLKIKVLINRGQLILNLNKYRWN